MEALSFFSSNKNLIACFSTFIHSYPKLVLKANDGDTLYFANSRTYRNEIYFHLAPNDIAYEFSYNYLETERKTIEDFFNGRELFLFDIQFRDEKFIRELLRDFWSYVEGNGWENSEQQILISHPHRGIVRLDEIEVP